MLDATTAGIVVEASPIQEMDLDSSAQKHLPAEKAPYREPANTISNLYGLSLAAMSNDFTWGPTNPHPLSQMRTELVWDGRGNIFLEGGAALWHGWLFCSTSPIRSVLRLTDSLPTGHVP